jgi:hypothetical protein
MAFNEGYAALQFISDVTADRNPGPNLPSTTAPQSDRQWLPPVGVAVDPATIRKPQ